MSRVLVAGTFDFFHAGHKNFLEQASQLGTELHVIISRDASVEKIKHQTPIFSEEERKKKLEDCPYVTKAYLGDLENFMKIPLLIQPDIIALGYDQQIPKKLKKTLPNTKIVRMQPHYPEQYKSSIFRKKQIQ